MDRMYKIKILEAIKNGLSLETAMAADKYSVLFNKQDHYSTALEGGERISKSEAELLQKHFPEILISQITGIVYDAE